VPEYDFRTLSPSDFELLVRDLLLADRGWRLEAFGHGRDGGVDLRGNVDGRKIVVQCKHYAGSTFSDLKKSAAKELPKMETEKPDQYLFVTSQNLSRTQKDSLTNDLSTVLKGSSDLLTQLDLNEIIGRHPQVERSHFKLWLASAGMLEAIVRSGLWSRSEALLEDVNDRVKLYVSNPGYGRAERRLNDAGVVVLSGAPGVGKSMLAEMLLLNHWHDGWQVIAVSSDIDEAWDSIKPSVKQIFYYDDFLGQTDISERNKNEDSRLVRFMSKVARDSTKRLVMTTRSQILYQAALIREPISRGDFRIRECVVKLSDYGPWERARILYNHLYFSSLPRSVVRDYALSGNYWKVINHQNFSPRIIEQVLRRNVLDAENLSNTLESTLDRPIDLWRTMFSTVLSSLAQRIVISLVTFPVEGAPAGELKLATQRDAAPIEYTNALKALEGTFITLASNQRLRSLKTAETSIAFANPSVRDFVLALLDEEPDYIRILIPSAVSMKQLLNLAQYAVSKSEGHLRFPGIATAMRNNSGLVVDHIRLLISHALRHEGTWHRNDEVLRPLSALLGPAKALLPTPALEVIVSETRQLITDSSLASADGEIWERFIRAEVDLHQEQADLPALLARWGEALETVEDVESFGIFIDEHLQSTDERDARHEYAEVVEAALVNDIDNISSNRNDEDSDLSWLDQIEAAADNFGLSARMHYHIESERDSIVSHYAEKEETYESMPTSGGGYFGSSPASTDTVSDAISNMFTELS